ncbi:hypothetical protein [Sphingosinicella xenopeptidilytica]|uniref:Uncharacterized protein n=1 Tax=Sphingosinicella xenopeptidilytica TaxID=364098 RepID=A0ABW3BXR2_SPHXN
MLDREKCLNWWTGRLSDQELADYTGMAPRAVGLVLNIPYLRSGVTGGGRGSKHSRRISPKTRNAVAIIHALSEARLTFEVAANIIAATPFIASTPTPVVDFSNIASGVRSLLMFDRSGGWLPTDVVPADVWDGFAYPCVDASHPNPTQGDIFRIPAAHFNPSGDGTMTVDRSANGLPSLRLRALTASPVYFGEHDPLGLYLPQNSRTVDIPCIDDHLLIVNGRWIFTKSPQPSPLENMQAVAWGEFDGNAPIEHSFGLASVIEEDRKTVRSARRCAGTDEEEARYHLKNFDSLLDVNITLAVRKMKRRAYGLPVGWADNTKRE